MVAASSTLQGRGRESSQCGGQMVFSETVECVFRTAAGSAEVQASLRNLSVRTLTSDGFRRSGRVKIRGQNHRHPRRQAADALQDEAGGIAAGVLLHAAIREMRIERMKCCRGATDSKTPPRHLAGTDDLPRGAAGRVGRVGNQKSHCAMGRNWSLLVEDPDMLIARVAEASGSEPGIFGSARDHVFGLQEEQLLRADQRPDRSLEWCRPVIPAWCSHAFAPSSWSGWRTLNDITRKMEGGGMGFRQLSSGRFPSVNIGMNTVFKEGGGM